MDKRKYEVLHPIRLDRNKIVKRGAVLNLTDEQAQEYARAVRILPGASGEEISQPADDNELDQSQGDGEPVRNQEGYVEVEQEVRVSHNARPEAEKLKVDLNQCSPTGHHNTITVHDVRRAAKERGEPDVVQEI